MGGKKNIMATLWPEIINTELEQSTRVLTVTQTPYTGVRLTKTDTSFIW